MQEKNNSHNRSHTIHSTWDIKLSKENSVEMAVFPIKINTNISEIK